MSQPPRRMKTKPMIPMNRVKPKPIRKSEKVTRVRFRFHSAMNPTSAEDQDGRHEEPGVRGHRDGVLAGLVDPVLRNHPERDADPGERGQDETTQGELVLGAVQGRHGGLALFGRDYLLGVPVHQVGSAEQIGHTAGHGLPLVLRLVGQRGKQCHWGQGTGAPEVSQIAPSCRWRSRRGGGLGVRRLEGRIERGGGLDVCRLEGRIERGGGLDVRRLEGRIELAVHLTWRLPPRALSSAG